MIPFTNPVRSRWEVIQRVPDVFGCPAAEVRSECWGGETWTAVRTKRGAFVLFNRFVGTLGGQVWFFGKDGSCRRKFGVSVLDDKLEGYIR